MVGAGSGRTQLGVEAAATSKEVGGSALAEAPQPSPMHSATP